MSDLDYGATIKGFNPGQKVFNRYTLRQILGRGGMGVVWLASDEELGRETALKFLPEVVALDPAAIGDLKREVRRAIELAHPHIVKIHDFVTDGRTAAVSMEYVTGQTLYADGGVTLHYDPDYTIELGERHVGLRFFAPIHHTVITRDGLAFFLDQNAGPDPDRCYRAAPG